MKKEYVLLRHFSSPSYGDVTPATHATIMVDEKHVENMKAMGYIADKKKEKASK